MLANKKLNNAADVHGNATKALESAARPDRASHDQLNLGNGQAEKGEAVGVCTQRVNC